MLGEILDEKYRIDKELGAGGMGNVYLATHLGTTRVVAVKVIAPRWAAEPQFLARFQREARACGRLAPQHRQRDGFWNRESRRRRHAVPGDGVSRRADSFGFSECEPADFVDAGGGLSGSDRAGAGGGAPAWNRPSRPEARQHLAGTEWPRRLR